MFAGLMSLGGIALTTGGLIVGYVISARTARLTSTQQAAATAKAAENTQAQLLIDQLQEELTRHREAQDARANAMDDRITGLEQRNHELMRERDAYRDHAHALRSHIYDGKPPPPPDWPEGYPR
ncbi:hypothetical protein ACFVTX_18250 [Agromyces sp. NPDC058136]|uniref:hypothetical protein n=1 Tax=Agromyces sp. NPDC058136 TaxID=3346354 RepID=UPI0036DBE148